MLDGNVTDAPQLVDHYDHAIQIARKLVVEIGQFGAVGERLVGEDDPGHVVPIGELILLLANGVGVVERDLGVINGKTAFGATEVGGDGGQSEKNHNQCTDGHPHIGSPFDDEVGSL